MNPPSGAGCVAAWAAQALQDDFALDIFSWTPARFDEINRFYGTTLDARRIKNFFPPAPLRGLFPLDLDPWRAQPTAMMMRYGKWIRKRYDRTLALWNEIDLGAPCIQYVHYPYRSRMERREKELTRRSPLLGFLYRNRPWRIISGFSWERMKQNSTLVNSDWTGRYFTEMYGAPTQTLYPPVSWRAPHVAWAERENGFVCIGRLSAEKRYQDIIAILADVRARGHALHLHIIGALRDARMDSAYYQRVHALVQEHGAWVTLHENIARHELEELVARQRYGIHAYRQEHFGIAPAEMVRGGCIVFVPNDGGQVEIVGNEPRLRYDSHADAVEKIVRVLEDARAQDDLRNALAARAELFSPERFVRELRGQVERGS